MKQHKLIICDTAIQPGEMANLAIALPKIYSCAPMYMPVKIAHGKNPGPCVVVFSMMNGYELNGLEIINRLMSEKALEKLNGTLIAIPVMNVFGMMHYPQILPHKGTLDDYFPGDSEGLYGDRVAHLITQEIFTKADYCIDLSSGGIHHDKIPQVFCSYDDTITKNLAKNFQAPVITEVQIKPKSLRSMLQDMNIPFVVYQGGEAHRHNESAILTGLNGLLNTLSSLEMIDYESTYSDGYNPVFSIETDWVLSSSSGVFKCQVELGEMVKENQVLGTLQDPFSPDFGDTIKATSDGVVVGVNTHPLVYEGQGIIMVSSFVDNQRAEKALEQWVDAQEEAEQKS